MLPSGTAIVHCLSLTDCDVQSVQKCKPVRVVFKPVYFAEGCCTLGRVH